MTMTTLSVAQAAQTMKIHTETVLELIRDGVIPAAKIGRAYVMMEKDVLAFVADQITRQTTKRRSQPIQVKLGEKH